jgi:hypothetical protein
MQETLLQFLKRQPGFHGWDTGESREQISAAETAIGRSLPVEHVELLRGGASSVRGDLKMLYLYEAREMIYFTSPPDAFEGLQGMVLFGHDGSDDLYFYDPDGKLGHGPWAIFVIDMPAASLPPSGAQRAIFVAADLRELVERILAGDSFERDRDA